MKHLMISTTANSVAKTDKGRLKKTNCTQKLDIPSKHTGAVFMTKVTLQITNRIPLFIQSRKTNWWDNTQMESFFAVLNEMLLPFRRIDGGRI